MPIASPQFQALSVNGLAPLALPAGPREHTVILALASGQGGVFNEIHDVVGFPQTERFVLPCFVGEAVTRRNETELSVTSPESVNPRDADNVSGTLVVELWALNTTYAGAAFEGVLLASNEIGTLAGNRTAPAQTLDVPRVQIAQDTALVLMLREWTATGYVTRDYRELAHANAAAEAPARKAASTRKPTAKKSANVASAALKAVAAKVAGTKNPKAKADTPDTRVSINEASEDELAAVKGLSRSAASGIVASRPYKVMDDVIKAKGMGEKLLARVRDFLRV
jgi:DNA uptake protein ComE-like DNA-binding protein